MHAQRSSVVAAPDSSAGDPSRPESVGSRRALLGVAASGLALAANGLLLPGGLISEAEAGASKRKRRRRRRRRRRQKLQGTPGLAVDLTVENRLGRDLTLYVRATNTNWGNQYISARLLHDGHQEHLTGRHDEDDRKTESRWEVFIDEGLSIPVWLMVENPFLWPMNVSVMEGGGFDYDEKTDRYDGHADRWLVERQWLLAGGSLVTPVPAADIRVTYKREPDTATHMVVHAWLDPA
jgi:hypothetical protein